MFKRKPYTFTPRFSRFANVLVNVTARKYGDSAIAAFSITNRILLIAVSIMFGLGQGFLPVVGFSFGAKKFDRIKKAYFYQVADKEFSLFH